MTLTSTNDTPPQLPPKKQGRHPPKDDDVAAAAIDSSPAQALAPSKQKHEQIVTTNNDSDVQAPKHTRAEASRTVATAKHAIKPTTKTLAQTIAKHNLPGCEGCNTHPRAVKGAGPAVRCSSQQVAADRDAIKKAAEEKLQRTDKAKAHLAEMHLIEAHVIVNTLH